MSPTCRATCTAQGSAAFCMYMTLRSAHLPGNYCDEAQACCIGHTCGDCCDEVLSVQDSDRADERRWRHIQHALLGCVDCDSLRRPSPRHLREDLLFAAAGYPAAEAAVRVAFPSGVLDLARLRQVGASTCSTRCALALGPELFAWRR